MKLVVLCGGSGTRLWPISRTSNPKQFVKIFNNKSLYQLTLERNKNIFDGFIIVVNEKQLKLCQEQLPIELKEKTKFIIEPIGRNTAPAITLAALLAEGEDMMVVPSDHLIEELDIYQKSIYEAKELSQKDKLITFGLNPNYPETGYGYIESDGNEVLSFKEKPNLDLAKDYIKAGNYYWNSGMFLFNSKFYLKELKELQPEIFNFSNVAFQNANNDKIVFNIKLEDMENIPKDSIDYAIMEKSKNVNVVSAKYKWTDLGSFDSLADVLSKDSDHNTIDANYININSRNNCIISNKRIITTFDVEDLIIVDTDDALLIGKKGQSQKVKDLLKKVEKKNSQLLD